jgi:hypothetical protein
MRKLSKDELDKEVTKGRTKVCGLSFVESLKMSNEQPTTLLKGHRRIQRHRSFSAHKQQPAVSRSHMEFDRKSSLLVWRCQQLAKTHSRFIACFDTPGKDLQDQESSAKQFEELQGPRAEMHLTPLKIRPSIRVIRFNKLEDSPDKLATEDSEIYKEYTRLPLNKENHSEVAPTSMMNKLLLISPKVPSKRPIASRVRIRPLMYVPPK